MSESPIVNYGANSHKTREAAQTVKEEPQRPKLEQIPGVKAVVRKKPLSRKIMETFNGDDMDSVGKFVMFDVILPGIKNILFDTVTSGLERGLYGSSTARRSGGNGRVQVQNHTNYAKAFTGGKTPQVNASRSTPNDRATRDFDEIIFDDRGHAEMILERLRDAIEEYGNVRVADLMELVEKTGPFTDNIWGWTNLRDARVRPVRGGYILDLPAAERVE